MNRRTRTRRTGAAFRRALVITALVPSFFVAAVADAQERPSLDSLLEIVNSNGGESWITTSPDGRIALFGRHDSGWGSHTVWQSEFRDGGWTGPEVASFSGTYSDRGARFGPGGETVIFSSDRPRSSGSDSGDFNLWTTGYEDTGWSGPRLVAGVNSNAPDWHASITLQGVLYFASRRPGGRGNSDLYRAVPGADGYEVLLMPERISTGYSESDVYVDPDDRYIVFARTDALDGNGGDDLYVSFKEGDTWSAPEHLPGDVNSGEYEYGAWVDGCTGRLFFTTHRTRQADLKSVEASALGLSRSLPLTCAR